MAENKHSHISADDEQLLCLNIQKKMSKESRASDVFLTAAFFLFIFVFAVLFWIMPDKAMSEEENRALQTFPPLSAEALTDGSFSADFANYMADQFPFRNTFIGIKAACERALLKGENNGVIIGDDGYLIKRYDKIDEKILGDNISALAAFKSTAEAHGIGVYCAFAGRTMDVAVSKIPASYGSDASDRAWTALENICLENSLEYTDLKTPLREEFEKGEALYYKTDHHWTTLGAYSAYRKLSEKAGLMSHGIDHYTRETVTDSFYGTTWSSAGVKGTQPDTIEFFRWAGDTECKTVLDTGETISGLYKTDALETKDKYSAFLGGNTARCDITSGEDRKTIIVAKDSFAHSLVPFLAEDYNIIMIDLRYYSGSLYALAEESGAEKILFIYNMDTLSNESGFRILRMGLDK